jgi:hypothetical protein
MQLAADYRDLRSFSLQWNLKFFLRLFRRTVTAQAALGDHFCLGVRWHTASIKWCFTWAIWLPKISKSISVFLASLNICAPRKIVLCTPKNRPPEMASSGIGLPKR